MRTKKLLVYSSKYSHEFEESRGFGWNYETEPKHDWSTLMANKNAELQRLTGIYKNILNSAGVTLIEGRGKIVDPHTIAVNGKLYTARHILISVGGRPFIPDIPGKEYAIDSDIALDLPSRPNKIAIVGGGYIALEFAGIFNGLRSDVHIFIRQKKVLRGFDEEVRDFVAEQMSLRGIEFHTEESPQAIIKSSDGLLSLKTNKGTLDGFSHVMFATGRRPNTKNLGLEEVGVKLSQNGAILVDEYSRTTVDSIWAVGDVTDRINLTPVALMEGGAFAKTLFGNEPIKPDYSCVLRGCVPKKLLVYSSKYSHEFEESRGFGWNYETEPKHDWSTLMANKNAELQRLTGIYKNILNSAGVTLIEGRGKIVDPHTIAVDGKLYTARHILISVGGRPFIPDIPGKEYAIDSDIALDLPSRPNKIAIVGGGYIALEFAGIFDGLRSDVHIFIRQKKVLRGFDEEVRDFVAEQMSLRGIEFHTEESPQAIIKSSDGLLYLKTNKGTLDGFSHVMFATGRRPNTKNLGLEEVGVKLSQNGAILVDEYSRTTVDSIWAVGDVTDRINLTPVALMEGGAFAKTLFGNEPIKPDYRAVPSAVFSQPPIGQVGLSEEQAIEEYGDVDIYTSNFRPLKATLSGLPDRIFMKIIVFAKTNKVLGVHMCGDDSAEIIQGIAIPVKAGLTKADFDATIGVHPTSAEEFVTMRSPTRKIRKSVPSAEEGSGEVKSPV